MTLSGSIEMAEKVDMKPYLSGGLCRMTKQAAACRWSTHGSQSDNRDDHLLALLCPAFLHCVHCALCTGYKCTLFSAPQSSVYGSISFFCSGVLEQFLPLRIAQISSLNMVLHPLSASCCSFVALLHWYFTAAVLQWYFPAAVVLSHCNGTWPNAMVLSHCNGTCPAAVHWC